MSSPVVNATALEHSCRQNEDQQLNSIHLNYVNHSVAVFQSTGRLPEGQDLRMPMHMENVLRTVPALPLNWCEHGRNIPAEDPLLPNNAHVRLFFREPAEPDPVRFATTAGSVHLLPAGVLNHLLRMRAVASESYAQA